MEKQAGYVLEIKTSYDQIEQVKYILNQSKISIKNIQYEAEPVILGESSIKNYEKFLINYINSKNYKLDAKILQEKFVDI